MEIRNIIFDWSGTISDDFGVLYEIVMEIFEEHDVRRVSREEFLASYSLPYMASINRFFNISKEDWDSKFRPKWEEKGFPTVFPEAMEVLDHLRARGVKMCIFTSHPEDFIKRELDLFFPGKLYFDKVIAGIYNKKDFIHEVLSITGYVKEHTLLVGDTTHDIEAGKHAGIRTAAVLSGYNTEDALRSLSPDFILSGISGLKAVI